MTSNQITSPTLTNEIYLNIYVGGTFSSTVQILFDDNVNQTKIVFCLDISLLFHIIWSMFFIKNNILWYLIIRECQSSTINLMSHVFATCSSWFFYYTLVSSIVYINFFKLFRSDQKFCNRYWQFYKPINIQEIVVWRNNGMSYLLEEIYFGFSYSTFSDKLSLKPKRIFFVNG